MSGYFNPEKASPQQSAHSPLDGVHSPEEGVISLSAGEWIFQPTGMPLSLAYARIQRAITRGV